MCSKTMAYASASGTRLADSSDRLSGQTLLMPALYQCDLAYVHASAFETLARGAAREIILRLQSSRAPVRRVLDLGCGAGPLTEALVDAGFEVTGVDTSAALLERARVRVPKARFVQASIYDTEIRDYDAVVALGEPLTYHPEGVDADNLLETFFQRVAGALPSGGLLIFDVIALGDPPLAGRIWRAGDDWAAVVETTENQADRTLVRDIEVYRRIGDSSRCSREIHSVRLFDLAMLRDRLSLCGFATETSRSYGAQQLLPRRHAFFATRLATTGGRLADYGTKVATASK